MQPFLASLAQRRRARRSLIVLFAALASTASLAQSARSPDAVTPLAHVLLDSNQDLVPDAVGDTFTVAGRATAASGQLHRNWVELFIQDGTAGIKIVASSGAPVVAIGDSVLARGRLDHELGMAQLTDPVFHVVDAPRIPVVPERVPKLSARSLEPFEGRLVELTGTVAARVPNEAGDNLILLVGDQILNVFVYKNRPSPFTFEAFEIGDYIRVRGIAAQFDRQAPFNASYLIYPREREDVTRAGLPPSWYRNAVVVVLLLLIVAGGWAFALRRQVRNRVTQLQGSEARYSHLFNAAGDSVLVHINDHSAGWVVDANATAKQTFGYTSGEFNKLTMRTIVAEGETPTLEQHLYDAAHRGGALHTIPLNTKGGRTIPFEIRTHRLDLEGTSAFLSIARDVSVRIAYEQGLIEAKRSAEEMEQLKSAFFINMSHEIRTPLTAIIGAAELLHDEVEDDQREFTGLIEHGGKRLLHTLNDVLEFAQLDAGEVMLYPGPVDLVEELQLAVAHHRPQAEAKNLALVLQTDVGSLPLVLAEEATRKVISHVIDNAIKFTEEGGVRVTLETKADIVNVHITDTGVGMDEEFLPYLFTEFKQESSGVARSHEGNGLGIAIAKKLMDLMGGRIGVLSRKDVGSVFTLTFPRTSLTIPIFGGDGAAATQAEPAEFS